MNLKFRVMQGLTNGTMYGYWLVRFLSDPHHPHLSMLLFTTLGAVFGELAYRAGKKEKEEEMVGVKTR